MTTTDSYRRYNRSDKGKVRMARYRESLKGQIAKRKGRLKRGDYGSWMRVLRVTKVTEMRDNGTAKDSG